MPRIRRDIVRDILKTIEALVAMICVTILIITAQAHGADVTYKLLGIAAISGLGGYSLGKIFEKVRR